GANAALAISGGSVKTIDAGHVLTNLGNATWTGTGTIRLNDVSTFTNAGTLDAQSDDTLQGTGTPGNLFLNNGLFKKTAGTGNTTLSTTLGTINNGNISLLAGNLTTAVGGNGF